MHHNFWGKPVPCSVLQLVFPRVELHLFYNSIVFIPMVIGMYYHMFPPESEQEEDGLHLRMGPQAFDASRLIRKLEYGESQDRIRLSTERMAVARSRESGTPAVRLRCNFARTGCSRPADLSRSVTIEHEISPEPARVGPAVVTLRLADAVGKAVTGAHITLEADMSHAGMAPVFGRSEGNRARPLPGSPQVRDGGGLGHPPARHAARRAEAGTPDRCERAFDPTRQAVESIIHPGPGSSRIAAL